MDTSAFDVIVIGGGHAGAEAAWAAGWLGARTAMITFDRAAIGRMSCNPAIGGIGKGQIVREIDALGGLMGLATDAAGIQFRTLNQRKGPAVQAPRAQCDRDLYAAAVRRLLESTPNLTIIEAGVEALEAFRDDTTSPGWHGQASSLGRAEHEDVPIDQPAAQDAAASRPRLAVANITGIPASRPRISAVRLADGRTLSAATVVVTTGTFLRALMHCGERQTAGGRIGEASAEGLSKCLRDLGLELGRLKTGTPPRIARDSIDYAALDSQPGDNPPRPFSFMTDRIAQLQVCCWITYTNETAHDLIRSNLHRAPMYSGQIQSRGPRYCPSIEDKVVRFADKPRHQIFLEPEGYNSDRIYCNGISTSLPPDVQEPMVRSIRGLEHARVLQWGYAVEYDFVPPHQTLATLESKPIAGLFLAGQINGTSGYEEAAGQGIVAGVNAARAAAAQEPVVLPRDNSYIGVMIDDLVTRGVTEPYRMFTSRAEHRLNLRSDNADVRLTPLGRSLGLVRDNRWARFEAQQRFADALRSWLAATRSDGRPLSELLRRPDVDWQALLRDAADSDIAAVPPSLLDYHLQTAVTVVNDIRYAGYVRRQEEQVHRMSSLDVRRLPPDLNYAAVPGLRTEARERLAAVTPLSLGQARRCPGITPADIAVLSIYLERRGRSMRKETAAHA